jgi:hypothetical protein
MTNAEMKDYVARGQGVAGRQSAKDSAYGSWSVGAAGGGG